MFALLATALFFSALATVPGIGPGVVPGFIPGTVPGLIPGLVTQVPALVPGTAPALVPATAVPAVIPSVAVPSVTVPGLVPAVNVPTTTVPSITAPILVPGVPAIVPGFVPGSVPGIISPSANALIFGHAVSPTCVPRCHEATGTTTFNGRTLRWWRRCVPCITRQLLNFRVDFTSDGCLGLAGDALNECCREGLEPAICGAEFGHPLTCTCNGILIACPDCSESKKGLLGLLGLLGIIPAVLCLSLLSCLFWLCCIRRTKKGTDVHFATYEPGAVAMPTVVEHCEPQLTCAPTAFDPACGYSA